MLNSNTLPATPATSGRRSPALSAAIFATLALATSSVAFADAELDALKKQVQELQQKIDAMAKQQAAAAAAAPAAAAPAAKPPVEVTATRPDGAVSMYGITLYGALDVNLLYQTHGTPLSDYFAAGTYSFIQKNSNHNIFTLGESGLSQSRIGLQGDKEIMNGWSGIFRLETAFNPLSGNLSDGLKSLTINNGVALDKQVTGADTSVNGELFNSAAFLGFSHKEFGTVTFGRQNGLLADGIAKFDPMAASQAFSVIGISGTAGGGGDTENRRLDNSLKYNLQYQALHIGGQYQFSGASGVQGSAYQFVLGGTFAQGSVDAFYGKKYDAIASASLSAAQVGTLGCPYSSTAANLPPDAPATCIGRTGGGGNALDKSLAGTVSDNTTYAIMAQFAFGQSKLFGGYEHITYANPEHPLPAGSYTIGGYVLAYVNAQAGAAATFNKEKILQIGWLGYKYSFSPALDWTLAWYHIDQNAYAFTGANVGCSDSRAANCSGTLDAVSTTVVYKLTKRFDTYGGAMWSEVKDGLANGFLNRTTVNPTVGVRYTF